MLVPSFATFSTTDGLSLSGLLYESDEKKKVAIYLHGNGSSSIFDPANNKTPWAEIFAKHAISFFLFNNRGAEYIKDFEILTKSGEKTTKRFGMSFEKIRDCIYDIDAAIAFLKGEGYNEFYLIGESTGANKICVYNFYRPKNEINKCVLLSGGDDTGIYYELLGEKQFFVLLDKSKIKIAQGCEDEIVEDLLVNKVIPCNIFSYGAFYDTINPDGDYNVFPFFEKTKNISLSKQSLFRYFRSLQKPTLVIYGEKDEYTHVSKAIDILRKEKPDFTYKTIKNADHSFSNHQKELVQQIINWLQHTNS